MATLSNQDRAELAADIQRVAENVNGAAGALTKAQLRAAVDAADQWCDDNASSYNSALPAAARNALTARQKASLLREVIRRRHEVS